MEIDQLVAELLARGDMNEETIVDLNRILEDWRAGRLDPDDGSYVRAFHARIISGAVAEPEPEPDMPSPRLDGLSIEDWRDRALKAEAELAQLEESARAG
ncbi:MAG: hypothetical protein ABIO40_04460 [Devosia sp.]